MKQIELNLLGYVFLFGGYKLLNIKQPTLALVFFIVAFFIFLIALKNQLKL